MVGMMLKRKVTAPRTERKDTMPGPRYTNPEYKAELVKNLREAESEWRKGADWPNEFDMDKWDMSRDKICTMHASCDDCFVTSATGGTNCVESPIAEAIGLHGDWAGEKDGPAYDEWRAGAVKVAEFFDDLLQKAEALI